MLQHLKNNFFRCNENVNLSVQAYWNCIFSPAAGQIPLDDWLQSCYELNIKRQIFNNQTKNDEDQS
jgi:hypothetical protein